jgi:hypothetical protein
MIKGVQTRVDSQIHPIALIENAEAIQAAIMHMIDAVLKGTIDHKRATLVLKALYIAVRNSRNVYFHLRQDDMVREVPNYAHPYLTEHPELNPDNPPDAVAPQPEGKPARRQKEFHQNECHPEEAQAVAKRKPANEGSMHFPAGSDAAPTARETAHPANNGNGATGSSLHPSKENDQKAWGENIPPLTTRQSEHWNEIKKLEASIEGAMHGDWRDLRAVFNAVGLTPRKPAAARKAEGAGPSTRPQELNLNK